MGIILIYLRVMISLIGISLILSILIMLLLMYGVSLIFDELFIKMTGKGFLYLMIRSMDWLMGRLFSLLLISCRIMVGKGIVLDKPHKGVRMRL